MNASEQKSGPTADALDADELETIEIIARNQQSGRITAYEVRDLVRVYRLHGDMLAALRDLVAYLRETPHHNAIQAAAARAVIARVEGR